MLNEDFATVEKALLLLKCHTPADGAPRRACQCAACLALAALSRIQAKVQDRDA